MKLPARRVALVAILAAVAAVAAASYDRERLEIAKQILAEVPLIDGYVCNIIGTIS